MSGTDTDDWGAWRAFVESLPRPPEPPCPHWCPGGHGIHPLHVDHIDGVASGAGIEHTLDLGPVEVSQWQYVDADGNVTEQEPVSVGLYHGADDAQLTAPQARQLAAALLRAADILDGIHASTAH
jgi:hypothetical protein